MQTYLDKLDLACCNGAVPFRQRDNCGVPASSSSVRDTPIEFGYLRKLLRRRIHLLKLLIVACGGSDERKQSLAKILHQKLTWRSIYAPMRSPCALGYLDIFKLLLTSSDDCHILKVRRLKPKDWGRWSDNECLDDSCT